MDSASPIRLRRRLRPFAWLALLAVLVQCLLPVGHALAMSRDSQDALFYGTICSYHPDAEPASSQDREPSANPLAGSYCPICQMQASGNGTLLPLQAFDFVHPDPKFALAAGFGFEAAVSAKPAVLSPGIPRGPPVFL